MKKIVTLNRFWFLLVTLVMLAACTRSSDTLNNDPSDIAASGTWRVTLFTDSGNDETSDFAGYSFSFNANGVLSASKNGIVTNGTWGTNSSSNKFNIDLGPKTDTNKPLGELTDDWLIISVTNTQIQLRDDNASSNEYLSFSKN